MNRIPCRMINPGNYGIEEINSVYPCWSSEYLEWVDYETDITIYVDQFDNVKSEGTNIAVLVEPYHLCPKNYSYVLENQHKFNLIFSYYTNFGQNEKFKYYNGGLRTFIHPKDRKIHKKTKNIFSIVSPKCFMPGHQLRHYLRSMLHDCKYINFPNPPMEDKSIGTKQYRFELVIENECASFFSEKILDTMLLGAIPIYWCDNTRALDVFDKNGIITFNNPEMLIEMIKTNYFNEELYNSKLESVKYNFKEAKKWISFGDVIWNCGLKEYYASHL